MAARAKWPMGSGNMSTPRFLGQLSLNKFFDPSTPSMRRGRNRGEKIKNKDFLVATNISASQPPERRPTGTPIARAKIVDC